MLCRLCVKECTNYANIFEAESLKYDISNLIARYFTFQVTPRDEHSTIVCKYCFDQLCRFYSFCCSVENAQEKWQIIYDLEVKDEVDKLNEDVEQGSDEEKSNQVQEYYSDEDNYEVSVKDEEEIDSNQGALMQEEDEESQCTDGDSRTLPQEEKSKKSRLSEEFDRLIASHTKLFCNECNNPMESFKDLKKHVKKEHGKAGFMICCKRKFFRAADLADHINIHLNPEYFKCSQCDRCFSSRYSLDFHLKTFHIDKKGDRTFFKCEHCSRKFLTLSVLEKHNQTQCDAKSESNKHLCRECGKCYPSESKLKAHHFNVHTMVYSRMCHLCGKIVRGNKALEQHQLQHAGINTKVRCEICGTELSTKGTLKAHMVALHPEDASETHVCTVCGKKAPSKRALKYHMDYVHKCERSHKCTLCDKSFKRHQALKEHITTHTGDRLYECPHCPKTFKVRSNMHHHRKVKHPKEFEENRRNRAKIK